MNKTTKIVGVAGLIGLLLFLGSDLTGQVSADATYKKIDNKNGTITIPTEIIVNVDNLKNELVNLEASRQLAIDTHATFLLDIDDKIEKVEQAISEFKKLGVE